MYNFFKSKTWFILFGIILVSLSLIVFIVYFSARLRINTTIAEIYNPGPPPTGDNVSGFAWSGNIGWISFNSSDCDIDGDGKYEGAGETGGPAPAGCPTSGTVKDYGVNIDSRTRALTGYAWSSNVGWISFNRSDTGNPPSNDPGAGSGPIAKYNTADNKIHGWAKILSLGDDGWIRFDHGQANEVTGDLATNELHGFAWNGNNDDTGIGWISFNCAEGGVSGENICRTSDYKVISTGLDSPPTAIGLNAPNWHYVNACPGDGGTGIAKKAILRWKYSDADSGDDQSAYQIILSLDNNSAAPNVVNTGKVAGSASQYIVSSDVLKYNTPYYWWIKVWDSHDISSNLTQYNSATDTDNDDKNNLTFTTYKHEFPNPNNFIWSTPDPSVKEEIKFTSADLAKYYTGSLDTEKSCDDINCNWFWEIVAPAAGVVRDSDASSTIIIFSKKGSGQKVKLTVTDNDGYHCSSSTSVTVKEKLPSWIESK